MVKAVSPEDDLGENSDQVALESIDADGSAQLHLSHQPAGNKLLFTNI